MAAFYIRSKGHLYRFSTFKELEEYFGDDLIAPYPNLIYATRRMFPKGEIISGHWGAYFKGWIDGNGESIKYPKGNDWQPTKLIHGSGYDVAF